MALLLKKVFPRRITLVPYFTITTKQYDFSTQSLISHHLRSKALTLDEEKAMYESYLVKHDKHYNNPEEKERRFQRFRETLRFIDRHNSTCPPSSRVGLTSRSDMPREGRILPCPSNDCGRTEHEVVHMFDSFILMTEDEEFCNTPEEKEKMFQIFRKFLMFMDNVYPPRDYAKDLEPQLPCGGP